ncbi:MAG: NusG domain II-containing protein [bacterium]
MKHHDLWFIGGILVIGLAAWLGFQLYERSTDEGTAYAQVFYQDELILKIDLDTSEYQLYNTDFRDRVNVDFAADGIFYVPGTTTTRAADDNGIIGIKLLVADGKIAVVYQESPKDICEYQAPTDSSLFPLVCLPNELVITIQTNLAPDQFVPDVIME